MSPAFGAPSISADISPQTSSRLRDGVIEYWEGRQYCVPSGIHGDLTF